METIKPDELSFILRTYEREGQFYQALGLICGFTLSDPPEMIQEDDLFEAIEKELGSNDILDMGMPKPKGEVLVAGKCYAPEDRPRPASRVAFSVGTLKKTLHVFGNRSWKGPSGAGIISAPELFTVMDISYGNAFGGPNYPGNPLGRGYEPVELESGKEVQPLPNIEDPDRLIGSPNDSPEPAGFGPLNLNWPQRAHKLGNLDDKWRRECWPYYPADMDWSFFNAAPWNQQIEGYFNGKESISVENMHPRMQLISSRLPGLRARCFIRQKENSKTVFKELPAHLETVWLFPGVKLGIVIYRGVTVIADEDAGDILLLMAQLEQLEEEPESIEYYRELMIEETSEAPSEETGKETGEETAAETSGEETGDTGGERSGMAGEALPGITGMAETTVPGMPVVPETVPAQETSDGSGNGLLRINEGGSYAGEDLTGFDLSGKNLQGCDFSGAVMENTNLRGANLTGANLKGAILTAATLAGAVLEKADLSGCIGPNASFVQANLKEADLSDADFSASDFSEADLCHAILKAAIFSEAKMCGAKCLETQASEAQFVETDLSTADFSGSELSQADFTGAVLEKTNFSKATLHSGAFSEAKGGSTVFTQADMQETRADGEPAFAGSDFSGTNLADSNWQAADFSGSKFNDTILTRAGLLECCFKDSILSGAKAENADLSKSDFTLADMTNINLFQGSLRKANLKAADLRGANLYGVDFYKVNLGETRLEGANLKDTLLSAMIVS